MSLVIHGSLLGMLCLCLGGCASVGDPLEAQGPRPQIAIYEDHREFSLPPNQRRWEMRVAYGVGQGYVDQIDVVIDDLVVASYATDPPLAQGRLPLEVDSRELAAGADRLRLDAWQGESKLPRLKGSTDEIEFFLVDLEIPDPAQ